MLYVFLFLVLYCHFLRPWISALVDILSAKISATTMYKRVEIGQSWRIPRDVDHIFESHPLFFNLKIIFQCMIFIQSLKWVPKLNFRRFWKKKHSTPLNRKLFQNLKIKIYLHNWNFHSIGIYQELIQHFLL